MSTVYLDTSALVKLYLTETGSDWIRTLLESVPAPTRLTSHLSMIEGACTFARRRREGLLSPEDYHRLLVSFDYDCQYHYELIAVEPVVVDTARRLADLHPLRAYDAVQLASAWLADQRLVGAGRPSLTFVCADSDLLSIAHTEGLVVENPNDHP
jgi:predicted nucleic acid-binding protein